MGGVSLKKEWMFLIQLCHYAITKDQKPRIDTSIDWQQIYQLAKFHMIESLVYEALEGIEEVPLEIKERFRKARMLEVTRDSVQTLSFEELQGAFDAKGVDYVPLKGFRMKALYPQPYLRSMSDIDLLYKKEDEATIDEVLVALSYDYDHHCTHHESYFRKPFMNIEVHHQMTDQEGVFETYFSDYWQRVKPEDGKKHQYRQTDEDFYIFMIAHMAKHFNIGGSGVRSMVDLWLFDKEYQGKLNRAYIKDALETLHLTAFEDQMLTLTKVWFENQPMTPFAKTLTTFIVTSGVYGTTTHSASQRIARENKHPWVGQIKTWRNVIFLPYKNMCTIYPYLKKYPVVLPYAWLHRIVRSAITRRDVAAEILKNNTSDMKSVENAMDILDKLGL